jgi:hypothetical protein
MEISGAPTCTYSMGFFRSAVIFYPTVTPASVYWDRRSRRIDTQTLPLDWA